MSNRKMEPRSTESFLLSGLVYCGECGRPMAGGIDRRNERAGKGAPWRSYRCKARGSDACTNRARVGAEVLENWVVRQMLDHVLTPANVQAWMAEMRALLAGPDLEAEIGRLDAEMRRRRTAIERLLDALEEGGSDVRDRLKQRRNELESLQMEREALTGRQTLAAATLSNAELGTILDVMRAGMLDEDMAQARRALGAFVERVEVAGETARITYRMGAVLEGIGPNGVPPKGHCDRPCNSLRGQWRWAENTEYATMLVS